MKLVIISLLVLSMAKALCSEHDDEGQDPCESDFNCYWSGGSCFDMTKEGCSTITNAEKCKDNSDNCKYTEASGRCESKTAANSEEKDPCFAADNIVIKENGDHIRIDELQITDRIATRFVDGEYIFNQVSFLKKKFAAPALRFVTETSWVGVSSNHFLTTQNGWVLAKDVNIKDKIRMASGQWEKVIDIEHYAELMYSVRTTDLNQEILVNGLYAMENSDGDDYLHRQMFNFLVFKVLLRSKYLAIFAHHFEQLCNGIFFSTVFIAAIFTVRQFVGVDSKLFKQA